MGIEKGIELFYIENKLLRKVEKRLQTACNILEPLRCAWGVKMIELEVMRAAFQLCSMSIDQSKRDPNRYLMGCISNLLVALEKIKALDFSCKELVLVEEICKEVLEMIPKIRL